MRLSNRVLSKLLGALRDIDAGRERVIKDGAVEKVVSEPFDLTTNFRFAMAVNIADLGTALIPFQKMTDGLFKKYAVDGQIDPTKNPEGWQAYNEEFMALHEQELDIELTTINRAELNLEKNKIKMTTLAALLPLIADASASG